MRQTKTPSWHPNSSTAQVELMLKYSSSPQLEVPDPYLDDEGFGHVFDLIDDAARGLLRHMVILTQNQEIW